MTFDREPDLDNANVGMPEYKFQELRSVNWKLPNRWLPFFIALEVNYISDRIGRISGERLLSCILRWEPVFRGERRKLILDRARFNRNEKTRLGYLDLV